MQVEQNTQAIQEINEKLGNYTGGGSTNEIATVDEINSYLGLS